MTSSSPPDSPSPFKQRIRHAGRRLRHALNPFRRATPPTQPNAGHSTTPGNAASASRSLLPIQLSRRATPPVEPTTGHSTTPGDTASASRSLPSIQRFRRATPPIQPTTGRSTTPDDAASVEAMLVDRASAADVSMYSSSSSGASYASAVDFPSVEEDADVLPADGADAGGDVIVEGADVEDEFGLVQDAEVRPSRVEEAARPITDRRPKALLRSPPPVTDVQRLRWDIQHIHINPDGWCTDPLTLRMGRRGPPIRLDLLAKGHHVRVRNAGTQLCHVVSRAAALRDMTPEALTPIAYQLNYAWGYVIWNPLIFHDRVIDSSHNVLRLGYETHSYHDSPRGEASFIFVPTMDVVKAIGAFFAKEMQKANPQFTAFDSQDENWEFRPMVRTFVVVSLHMHDEEDPWTVYRRVGVEEIGGKKRVITQQFDGPDYDDLTVESHIHPFLAIFHLWYKLQGVDLETAVPSQHIPLVQACLKVFQLWMQVNVPLPPSVQPKKSFYAMPALVTKRSAQSSLRSSTQDARRARPSFTERVPSKFAGLPGEPNKETHYR